MAVLRIGICDDLADARLVLRSMLERILENQKVPAQFFEFSAGETLLHWYDHHTGELDVLFLDMELHELDGMETARRLRKADAGLQLVFVTGYSDHVFDGYSVGALGYLLKPPKQEQLQAVLERAQAALYRDLERATSAETEKPTTAFRYRISSTLPLIAAKSCALHRGGPMLSTPNWMRWQRKLGKSLSAFISGTWFEPARWSASKAAR